VANVEGDVAAVDGVLRITEIRIQYQFEAPKDLLQKAERALQVYADLCPAYQSVKNGIDCSWDADIKTV
jgi:uncharacterized OsmC-like protein